MLEVAGVIKMQWETHSRGHYTAWTVVTGSTVPEKLGSRETPGDGRRVGPQLTITQRVLGLVRELGCVKCQAIIKNSSLQPREFHSKRKRCAATVQGYLLRSSWPVKEEEEGRHMDWSEEGNKGSES